MSLNARPLGNELNTVCAVSAIYLTMNMTIPASRPASE
jgi:hypothetical protein